MVTAVKSSTSAQATAAFNGRRLDRNQDGTLWEFTQNSPASVTPRYSKDSGATWTAAAALAGLSNVSVFLDVDDYAHLIWKQSGTSGPNGVALTAGDLLYMRGTPNTGRTAWTWSTPVAVNTSGQVDYPDVVAHREGAGWVAHCVYSSLNGTPVNAALYRPVTISSGGALTLGTALTLGSYGVAAHTYPSIDFGHTGDGKTVGGSGPHLYVGWNAGAMGGGLGVRFRKAVYSAGSWLWNAELELDATHTTATGGVGYWQSGQFDGTRFVICGVMSSQFSGDDVILHDRDAADTTTTKRTLYTLVNLGQYNANALYSGASSFDVAGNVYLFGQRGGGANGPAVLQWRKWTRSTATIGPTTDLDTTGNGDEYLSAKRGYSAGGSIEVVWTDGASSPYTVQYDRTVVLNQPPSEPQLVDPPNATSRDLAAGYPFAWTPQDPDGPADTQLASAFRRKVSGAAAYEWWNAATGVWQSTEVYNPGAASSLTFGAGKWTTGLVYNWSVSTKDEEGRSGPYATDATVTAGRAPIVTVNTPSGTVTNTTRPVVGWSYFDVEGNAQETYQVRIIAQAVYGAVGWDATTSPSTAAAVDETPAGEVVGASARTWQGTVDLANGGTYRAYVRGRQAGGQYSVWAFSAFTLTLTPPNAPTLTVTDEPDLGRVRLEVQSTDLGPDFTPANSRFIVEYLDSGGWAAVRGGTAVPLDSVGHAVVFDYEALLGESTSYRARTVGAV